MELKRVGVLSVGKVLGILYAAGGLVAGALFALVGLIGLLANDGGAAELGVAIGMGVALPIVYGVAGFLGGMFAAWLYNMIARFFGGIELEIEIPGLVERQFE